MSYKIALGIKGVEEVSFLTAPDTFPPACFPVIYLNKPIVPADFLFLCHAYYFLVLCSGSQIPQRSFGEALYRTMFTLHFGHGCLVLSAL
jgi:hypothetical protein